MKKCKGFKDAVSILGFEFDLRDLHEIIQEDTIVSRLIHLSGNHDVDMVISAILLRKLRTKVSLSDLIKIIGTPDLYYEKRDSSSSKKKNYKYYIWRKCFMGIDYIAYYSKLDGLYLGNNRNKYIDTLNNEEQTYCELMFSIYAPMFDVIITKFGIPDISYISLTDT